MQFVDSFVRTSKFPSTSQWKRIVKCSTLHQEEVCFHERLDSDSDFQYFKIIHNKTEPLSAWTIAFKHGHLTTQCKFEISLCALVKPSGENVRTLCQKCGFFYDDPIIHIVSTCSSINSTRDAFWCDIINIGPIDFSATLHSLDDTNLALILLSCDSERVFKLSPNDAETFSITCIHYLYKMCKDLTHTSNISFFFFLFDYNY